jgi:Tfp pilus assembly protein PilF
MTLKNPGLDETAAALKTLLTRAMQLRRAGQLAEFLTVMRQAEVLEPQNPVILLEMGQALLETGKWADAVASLKRAIALRPEFAQAHWRLGLALENMLDAEGAMAAYMAALSHDASIFGAAYRLAWLLEAADHPQEAADNYRRAAAHQPKPASFVTQAQALRLEHRLGDAKRALRQAIAHDPKHAPAHALLGDIFSDAGQFDEAFECYLATLENAPGMARVYHNLAQSRRMTAADTELVDQIRSATQQPSFAPLDKAMAGFALGKCLDDMDRFDEAFAAFKSANEGIEAINSSAGKQFNFDFLRNYIDGKIARKSPQGPSFASNLPVFIVGMPRSGTSLVEQLAASHSQIHGAGELRKIQTLSAALARGDGSVRDIAQAHLAWLENVGGGAKRVIDKLPDNILFLDTVAAVFSGAKVIFCVRDARDVSLSCYFQLFSSGNEFSYNLVDCGRRELQIARLMRHWQKSLPLAMLTVSYESLVESPEVESRRIVDFLEVAWEPGVLDFHRTNRTVVTASRWQVRQPLYNRAVGRWKYYRDHLGELEAVLSNG